MSASITNRDVAGDQHPVELERHGIDYIPPEDRHGKPRLLLSFWAANNFTLITLTIGVLAVVIGLGLPWAIAAIVIGNLAGGVYMALHSVQGPRLGIPQMMQSRAQFGMFGSVLPMVIVTLMYIGYVVTGAILGGEDLAALFHITTTDGILIVNGFVLLVVWVGYDLFHFYNKIIVWFSAAIFCVILGKLVTELPSRLPVGHNSPGTVLLVIAVVVAYQVTWAPYVSDYSRYLPQDTPGKRTFWYTYIGSSAGGIVVESVGALAAVVALSAVSASAPSYLSGLLGVKWLFLIIFILGICSGNFSNLYCPFLVLLSIISPSGKLASRRTAAFSRIITTTVVMIVCTVIAIVASSHFLTFLTHFLVFTLYLLVPWTAINLTDYYAIRKGRYNIPELFKVNGEYGKVNWYALIIYVLAVGVQLPFMNNAVYVGPVSTAMGGADISWIVGFVFGCVAYFIVARTRASRSVSAPMEALPDETLGDVEVVPLKNL